MKGARLRVVNGEPDEVLAIRARTDREAFGILYERHVRRVYNYMYYRTGSVADAEDLTARTFFQALNNMHRYQVQGVPFSAWLFRIAHNLVANWHRDTGRHHTISTDGIVDLPTDADGPHDTAEMEEERRELHAALRRLPADRQQLLILKYVEQLSTEEIAVIMGRSEGAIKALLHRTIKSLREELSRTKRGG
ncbi:MAG TPA: sigma-70 family RNA polymerase sigma factor [Chloroflexota bacterium]|nr:sigma-70 family RNA polymerase sigma factor [Chloroflexota bacterium]